jgi:hypothetical protein
MGVIEQLIIENKNDLFMLAVGVGITVISFFIKEIFFSSPTTTTNVTNNGITLKEHDK